MSNAWLPCPDYWNLKPMAQLREILKASRAPMSAMQVAGLYNGLLVEAYGANLPEGRRILDRKAVIQYLSVLAQRGQVVTEGLRANRTYQHGEDPEYVAGRTKGRPSWDERVERGAKQSPYYLKRKAEAAARKEARRKAAEEKARVQAEERARRQREREEARQRREQERQRKEKAKAARLEATLERQRKREEAMAKKRRAELEVEALRAKPPKEEYVSREKMAENQRRNREQIRQDLEDWLAAGNKPQVILAHWQMEERNGNR